MSPALATRGQRRSHRQAVRPVAQQCVLRGVVRADQHAGVRPRPHEAVEPPPFLLFRSAVARLEGGARRVPWVGVRRRRRVLHVQAGRGNHAYSSQSFIVKEKRKTSMPRVGVGRRRRVLHVQAGHSDHADMHDRLVSGQL